MPYMSGMEAQRAKSIQRRFGHQLPFNSGFGSVLLTQHIAVIKPEKFIPGQKPAAVFAVSTHDSFLLPVRSAENIDILTSVYWYQQPSAPGIMCRLYCSFFSKVTAFHVMAGEAALAMRSILKNKILASLCEF